MRFFRPLVIFCGLSLGSCLVGIVVSRARSRSSPELAVGVVCVSHFGARSNVTTASSTAEESPPTVAELVELFRPDVATDLRRGAALWLARMHAPAAREALLRAFLDLAPVGAGEECRPAMDALDSSDASAVLDALIRDDAAHLADDLQSTLGRIADAATITALHACYRSSTADWQRIRLMNALLHARSPSAIPGLKELLANGAEAALQSQAALALGQIPSPEARAVLTAALGATSNTALSETIRESLALSEGRII